MLRFVIFLFVASLCFAEASESYAKDTYVKGYTRKDGTYVRPHIRSSPDAYKSNNYGPSRDSSQLMNPRARDNDYDGVPNYSDHDDDNDNIHDDNDASQYGR